MNPTLFTILRVSIILFGIFSTFEVRGQSITSVKVSVDNHNTGIVNGVVKMDVGKRYNGTLAINDTAGIYPWKVKGNNFGTAKGTVRLDGHAVPISNSNWGNTEVIINICLNDLFKNPLELDSEYTSKLKLTTAQGRSITTRIRWVPAVEGRIFGQCTWWVAKNRKAARKSVPRYSDYALMTRSWVPQPLQGLKWSTPHNALIDSVQERPGGAFRVRISEYNAKGHNALSRYSMTVIPTNNEYPTASYNSQLKANGYAR